MFDDRFDAMDDFTMEEELNAAPCGCAEFDADVAVLAEEADLALDEPDLDLDEAAAGDAAADDETALTSLAKDLESEDSTVSLTAEEFSEAAFEAELLAASDDLEAELELSAGGEDLSGSGAHLLSDAELDTELSSDFAESEMGGDGKTCQLCSLIEIARRHPGLRISLSYEGSPTAAAACSEL